MPAVVIRMIVVDVREQSTVLPRYSLQVVGDACVQERSEGTVIVK